MFFLRGGVYLSSQNIAVCDFKGGFVVCYPGDNDSRRAAAFFGAAFLLCFRERERLFYFALARFNSWEVSGSPGGLGANKIEGRAPSGDSSGPDSALISFRVFPFLVFYG